MSDCEHCDDCQGVNGHRLDSQCLTEFDQRKLAAIIRHFGTKINDKEDAYVLEIPLQEVFNVPKNTTVIPADDPNWEGRKKAATVAYICFTGEDDVS